MIRNQGQRVIPIWRVWDGDELVADLAFSLWLSAAFRDSPEHALLTSVEMVRGQTRTGCFLVPKRKYTHTLTSIRQYP